MTDAKVNIDRELELIDGMIEVQLHHAKQCDGIANRTMAEKQKGWDMERVALLRKMRSALAADPSMDTVLRNAARRSATIVDRGRMVQPVEPVAWLIRGGGRESIQDGDYFWQLSFGPKEPFCAWTNQAKMPVYAAPPAPAAVPLTAVEIHKLAMDAQIEYCLDKEVSFEHALARAIERAHGIAAAGDKP